MTASAVAMKSALPSPQPRRKPAISPMLDAAPASALNSTTSTSPASSVRRGPMRELTQPPTSIETPVIAK